MPVASLEAFGIIAAPAPRWRGQTPIDDYGFDEEWALGAVPITASALKAKRSTIVEQMEEKALQKQINSIMLQPAYAQQLIINGKAALDRDDKAIAAAQAQVEASKAYPVATRRQAAEVALSLALSKKKRDEILLSAALEAEDKRKAAIAEIERKMAWAKDLPWYRDHVKPRWPNPFAVGDEFFEWMMRAIIKIDGKIGGRPHFPSQFFPQPPYDAADDAYGQWVYVMKVLYPGSPPPPPASLPDAVRQYEGSMGRRRPMGTWAEVAKVITAPFRFVARNYTMVIGLVGAALAPFTGGASMAASSLILAANKARLAANAASGAKRAAAADAAQRQALADKEKAATAAMVDQFYKDQNAWFLQHDMTPDKWAKLTLDEKIGFIEAGAKGTLPGPVAPILEPGAAPAVAVAPVNAVAPSTAPGAPGVPAYLPPPPTGYVPPPPSGYAPSYEPPPPAAAPSFTPAPPSATAGIFELLIEGRRSGTFDVLQDAAKEALKHTAPGDRFEVIANGRSTGLRIRTSSGSMEVPKDIEMKVRSMPWSDMAKYVAEAESVTPKSGGFPWWILLVAGGAKATGVI